MNPFSWKMAQERYIKTVIRNNKALSKSTGNPDWNLKHPAWIRDAVQGNYTVMITQTKDEIKKYHVEVERRRQKRIGH